MTTMTTSRPVTAAAPTGPVVIEASGITRTYGQGSTAFTALHGVDLRLHGGESVSIVGRSGSGKSTLMHILALLDQPTSGRIRVNNRNASGLSSVDLARLRSREFGFVFQQFFLVPGQTVLENVMAPLVIAGVGRRERRARAGDALEQLGLSDKARNRGTDLSGGQKQRVAIARALVNDPSVLFADEPTGNLDSVTGDAVEELLLGLPAERGLTLVVVTHDAALASRCSRTVEIADGRIVTQEQESGR